MWLICEVCEQVWSAALYRCPRGCVYDPPRDAERTLRPFEIDGRDKDHPAALTQRAAVPRAPKPVLVEPDPEAGVPVRPAARAPLAEWVEWAIGCGYERESVVAATKASLKAIRGPVPGPSAGPVPGGGLPAPAA